MTTDVLAYGNKTIISTNLWQEIPTIYLDKMDHKGGANNYSGINEMTSETETYPRSISFYNDGDLCGDTESDEVFETGVIPSVQDDPTMKELKQSAYGDTLATNIFPKERSISHDESYVSLEEPYTSLKETNTHLKEPYSSFEETYSSLEEPYTSLKETNTHLKEPYSSFEETYSSLEEPYTNLEEKNTHLKEPYSSFEGTYSSLEEPYTNLKETNTHLKEPYSSFEETYSSLEESYTSLEETNTPLNDPYTNHSRVEQHGILEEIYTRLNEPYSSLEETITSLKEPTLDSSDTTTSEIRIKELKEFSCKHNENDGSSISGILEGDAKCPDPLLTQKRVRLTKAYAWIKEEMELATARCIADHLFQSQQMLLSNYDHECIHATKIRRDSVEVLLKRVLMGPDTIYDTFVSVLQQEGSEHIAEHLNEVRVNDMDIEVFSKLEMSAKDKQLRPNMDEPRLTFTKRNRRTLEYWLNDKGVVDSINDQFLSRIIFRIDEHTYIADNSMDKKHKVRQLLRTMTACSENILVDFFQILKLDTVSMPHVIEKLENRDFGAVISRQKAKRKSSSTIDDALDVAPAKLQRKLNTLDQAKQSNIVKAIQESGSNIREKALELDMVFDEASEGSIIIRLSPRDSNSLRTLKMSCRTGKIKDFIPEVFRNNASDLEEGEYMFRLIIYLLPTPPYSQADKKVIFEITEQPTSTDIEENSKLLCQELEITDKLLTILKKEKFVGENIKQDIAKLPRRRRIKYLLDELALHGDRAYKILKDYIKNENKYLYEQLISSEETRRVSKTMQKGAHVTSRPESATKENRKEIFYTASVILLVKKSGGENREEKRIEDVEITCPKIERSECHFTDEGDSHKYDSDEEFLSLDENWSFDKEHQENKELPEAPRGKRKIESLNQVDVASESVSKKSDVHKSTDKETTVETTSQAHMSSSFRKEQTATRKQAVTEVKKTPPKRK